MYAKRALRIATYNAAGLRARMPTLLPWMEANEPDVFALQETKVEDGLFPREPFEEMGYEIAVNGQKGFNGVALLSRLPMENVRKGLGDDLLPEDARVISARIAGVEIVNTYLPNGNAVGNEMWAHKMRWMESFARVLRARYSPEDPLIWLGDVNVAPKPEDVYDSRRVLGGVGHHPDEFARLNAILSFGLTDLWRAAHPGTREYTFYDFRARALDRDEGWRIDHIYGTGALSGSVERIWIDGAARRGEKPSDHTFVVADLDI